MSDELEVFCEGIADAIRTKKETSATINAQNFREEILSIKSGVELNGLIKEYKLQAGENISAGDFVEYLNNIYKPLTTVSYSCYFAPSAVLLEPNKVFIAHSYSSNYYLYGTIVEINGTEMTAKTTRLNSTSDSCYFAPSCILLENNKVFIAHAYSSNKYLYGTIVEIEGTTMTATTTRLSELNLPGNCYLAPSCILLENNKLFIAHSYNRRLYGTIVEIDGTTMTPTSTKLNTNEDSCYYAPSCCLLEENKVFIAHSYDDYSQCLYGTIVTIEGTNMTPTSTQLNSTVKSCYFAPSAVLLEPNKVFIAHSCEDYSRRLYGTIVTINGIEMTATSAQLNSTYYNCYYAPSCCLLEENKIFIAHCYDKNHLYLYETIVEINGTEMTAKTTQLNTNVKSCEEAPSCILLENNKVFIAHHYDSARLYGTIPVGDGVKPYETKIFGVAKTGGVPGDTIQVYVPNTAE